MVETDNQCPRCGALQSDKSGSLTQWMFLCHCNFSPGAEGLNGSALCSRCGKRVADGRNGSLTQWVFGSSICSCSRPKLSSAESSNATYARHETRKKDSQDIVTDIEPELSVDPVSFPIDRYKPLAKLGSGSSGEVFLCRDRMLHNKVALKRLHQLNPDQLISFQNEARSTSSLRHSSIINIRDFGATASGAPYMVMEYFPGENLESFIRVNGPLPWQAALSMTLKLCEALDCAHRNGIFHRDLKPENVLLSINDSNELDVRLIDFGIANYDQSNQTTTAQGVTLVGTPAYMSPDQACGLKFDARSEIYSLGCVLYESLTGRPPFVGHSALEILAMHVNQAPASVSDFVEVPAAIDTILRICLNKAPQDRYQSMEELATQIKDCDQDSSRPVPSAIKSGPPRPYSRTTIIALLSLALSSIIVFALWNSKNDLPRRSRSKETAVTQDINQIRQNEAMDKALDDIKKNLSPVLNIPETCERANKLLLQHKPGEAEKLYDRVYKEVLQRDPTALSLPSFRYRLVSCKIAQAQYKESEILLRQIIADSRISPTLRSHANRDLSTCLFSQNKFAESIPLLKSALAETSHIESIQVLRCQLFLCYWQTKQYKQAEHLLKIILSDKTSTWGQSQYLCQIASTLREKHNNRALEICRKSVAMCGQTRGNNSLEMLPSLQLLLALLIDSEKKHEVLAVMQRELLVFQSNKKIPRVIATARVLELAAISKRYHLTVFGLTCCDHVSRILEEKAVPDDLETADQLSELVKAYCSLGMTEKSMPLYQRALAIYEKLESAHAVDWPLWMALQQMNLSEFEKEKYYIGIALANYEKQLGRRTDTNFKNEIQMRLATCNINLAKYGEAEEILERLAPTLSAHAQRAYCDHLQIVSYRLQFKLKEAEKLFEKNRSDWYSSVGFHMVDHMAWAYLEAGQFDKARALCDRIEKFERDKSIHAVSVSLLRSMCCHLQNHNDEAEKFYRKAVTARSANWKENINAMLFFANFLETRGKSTEARAVLRQVMAAKLSKAYRAYVARVHLTHLSQVFGRAGRPEEADRLIDYANALKNEFGHQLPQD